MADTMQQVLVRLPVEMYEELKQHAQSEDRTIAAEMRRALRRHLQSLKESA